jgi:hypothetical protein
MAAPGVYRDAVVQVSGQLRKQPVIVCDSDLRASPASWGLAEEGVVALAGGFDDQVRSLLPGDLQMTAEGRWRLWQGLVGCGKQAQRQDVWYLDVNRILSPSPLTQVTLTPGSGISVTAVAEVSPVGTLVVEGLETPTVEFDTPPEEPPPTELPDSYPAATDEPPLGGIPLPTPAGSATLPATTPLASGTPTPPGTPGLSGTPTATTTGTPATSTPTVTGTPATPTPTSTGGAPGQIVSKGSFFDQMNDDFMTARLEAGRVDSWDFELSDEDNLYVYVIAPSPADIILSVVKDGQAIVNQQNSAPAGSPEFINGPTLQGEGTYQVHVAASGGSATEYGIAAYTDPEFPVIIAGFLTPGSPRSAVQLPELAIHLWFFPGSAGQNVTVRLDPVEELDIGADVYGPGAEYLDTADDGFEGDTEDYPLTEPLTETGLHALRVYEASGEPMTYDVQVTAQ